MTRTMLPQLHNGKLAFILCTIAIVSEGLADDGIDKNPVAKTPTSQTAATIGHGLSSSNIQHLLAASLAYAKKNKGAVPASLQSLAPYIAPSDGTLASQLKNPERPELEANGYIYVTAQEKQIDHVIRPKNRVALYEAGDFRDGVNVGFWDGHVEWIAKRSQFDALLAAVVPRSIYPRQFDPKRPETFGRVDQKASAAAQSFQIVRELTEAVVMHTEDNRSGAPTDLKNLGAYLLQPNGLTPVSYLTNPRRPQCLDKGYEYIGPKAGHLRVDYHDTPDTRGLGDLPVVYEAGNIDDGIFIGFWDAHTEYVRDKADVEKLLAAVKPAP